MEITQSNSLINKEVFKTWLAKALNDGMKEAAEPLINKAMEDIEKTMREKLASMIVSFIDTDFEIETLHHAIKIVVRHDHHR